MQSVCPLPDHLHLADLPSTRQLVVPEPGSVPLVPATALQRNNCRRAQPSLIQQNQHHLRPSTCTCSAQLLSSPTWSSHSSASHQHSVLQLNSYPSLETAVTATLPFAPQAHQLDILDDSFACSSPAGPSEDQRKRNSEFQINFGRAIRSLREDIPSFFMQENNMSIYAEDMHFRDNISAALWSRTFDLHGLEQYRRHCQRMRMVFNFLFKRSDVSWLLASVQQSLFLSSSHLYQWKIGLSFWFVPCAVTYSCMPLLALHNSQYFLVLDLDQLQPVLMPKFSHCSFLFGICTAV